MRIVPSAFLAISVGNYVPCVLGWGAAGHEVVATIAQMYLHPTALTKICTILNFTSTNPNEPQCHLAPVATWADRFRYKMRWSAPLHYVGALDDYPSQTCAFPGDRGWAGREGGNVLGAIRNVTTILEDWDGGWDEKSNEALKFLIHFIGDLHMPLHLTGRDRGGNSVKVLFDRRQTNLHSLWDGFLIAKAIRTVPLNYSRPLPYPQVEFALRGTIYDTYIRRIMWEGLLQQWADEMNSWLSCPATEPHPESGFAQQVLSGMKEVFRGQNVPKTDDEFLCPHHWAKSIHALNCEIVWPKELDEPPYNHVDSSSDEQDDEVFHHPYLTPEQELELVGDKTTYATPPGHHYLQLDTPAYAGVIGKRMIIEKLLAQAGVRLAGVLNLLFMDQECEVGDVTALKVPRI